MLELGKYTTNILAAYGVSFALLALIIVQSVVRNARARRRLADQEARNAR